ncbi:CocE/NonD family hydrolase [Selenomonas sp. TAMA-11512]|uniref:CocE/NonD family hydrolase n=1 Tax=Selenomonas sp. TAMA-11512 TaxID=3095337 RepID=UPI00308F9676|nr:CocE/NonD family hydrolase [Selenomonas sp. TAMA-11512]
MRKPHRKRRTAAVLAGLWLSMMSVGTAAAEDAVFAGLERSVHGSFQPRRTDDSVKSGRQGEPAQAETTASLLAEPIEVDENGSILIPKVMANGETVPVRYRKGQPLTSPRVRAAEHKRETMVLRAGTVRRAGARPLSTDILFEKDVPVTLRDGTVIYTDIFRPAEDGKYPALLAWSPYGKEIGGQMLDDVPHRAGVPLSATSGLEKFEGPDPAYWAAHGYAVIQPDTRGAYYSEGNLNYWGSEMARDGYDVIEWAAAEPWSNGRIGMSGNSWLAVSQWFIAGAEPPHLAAIAPWEGFSDHFRETAHRGGIPNPVFPEAIFETFASQNYIEDQPRMIVEHPLLDAYWQDKIARLDRIRIPAYVVASYTNPVHTSGTFAGFRKLAAKDKWLRVHNTNEWADYYTPSNVEDLRKFFDRYLKGEQNDWEMTPRVRLSVLDPGYEDVVNRAENAFPLARTEYYKLFLHADRTLSPVSAEDEGRVGYDSEAPDAKAVFTYIFDEDIELTGYMKLRLFAEADGSDDMDIHVTAEKLDVSGKPFRDKAGQPIAAEGYLRLSQRALAPESTFYEPVLKGDAEDRLRAGEIVQADIAVSPMGMKYHRGEGLRLTIEPYVPPSADIVPPFGKALIVVPKEGYTYMPGTDVPMAVFGGLEDESPVNGRVTPPPSRNRGKHVFRLGGEHASYLVVPVVPEKAESDLSAD